MMERDQFAYLVRHELKLETRRLARGGWFWIYAAVIAVVILAALAIWGGEDALKPDYLLFACFAFPYFFCMLAYRMIKREWSDGTVGWWLSLPYSRLRLLSAKLVASFAQSMAISVLFFAAVAVLELYYAAVNGVGFAAFGRLLEQEGEYLLLLIVYSPMLLALGLLLGLLHKSSLKPLMPLFWILFGLSGNVFNFLGASAEIAEGRSWGLFDGTAPAWAWLAIPAFWLVGAALFSGAVNICKKHLIL
ncbi:ABC transporter permease [Cohnella fermenti]|uniref:Uncharacterized protein n=1 Tax=Cohnella fermenti TaxID=2565925 RepID=A0A4S4BKS3_9BACL|nr:ABC transporter permease [Cohnella fermenti]THF75121.1 hypothetical protein E6C55_22825 [Cohnella fermenti]